MPKSNSNKTELKYVLALLGLTQSLYCIIVRKNEFYNALLVFVKKNLITEIIKEQVIFNISFQI